MPIQKSSEKTLVDKIYTRLRGDFGYEMQRCVDAKRQREAVIYL